MDNERIGTYEVFAMTGNLVKLIIRKFSPAIIINTNSLL